jgi:hypothetical protein
VIGDTCGVAGPKDGSIGSINPKRSGESDPSGLAAGPSCCADDVGGSTGAAVIVGGGGTGADPPKGQGSRLLKPAAGAAWTGAGAIPDSAAVLVAELDGVSAEAAAAATAAGIAAGTEAVDGNAMAVSSELAGACAVVGAIVAACALGTICFSKPDHVC